MSRPSKVWVFGPFAGFAVGFAAELARLGYSPRTVEAQLRLMNHLSSWLAVQRLSGEDLSAEVIVRFVATRRSVSSYLRSERALVRVLTFLRGCGAAPEPTVVVPVGADEVLIRRFGQYLSAQKGLAPATVDSYLSQVRFFVAWHASQRDPRWAALTAVEVERFIVVRADGQRPRSLQVGLNALRAFLRWMWREGVVLANLADGVASVATWTPTALPKELTLGQVGDLLTGLSVDSSARCRDEAMLALMWRLGLRAGEVASLCLDDINWRTGVIVVHAKGDRCAQVPLPTDVGELLTAYLREARPVGTAHRQVFLAVDAPHQRIGTAAVSSVAARAAARGGVPGRCAAHRLRHTAACRVLAAGGGLVEAGQLLRHASPATTALYARTDVAALAVLVRPWPAGVCS